MPGKQVNGVDLGRPGLRVLVDLDDVLADFTGAACKAHGVMRSDVELHRILGEWSLVPALGRCLGRFDQPLTVDEFRHSGLALIVCRG